MSVAIGQDEDGREPLRPPRIERNAAISEPRWVRLTLIGIALGFLGCCSS